MNPPTPERAPAAHSSQAALGDVIALYRQRRFAEARGAVQALLARDPASVTAWNLLGHLERDVGETAAAAAAFDKALKRDRNDSTARKGRARMALERSEEDFAELYAAALQVSPGDPRLMLELAEARLGAGDSGGVAEFARFVERLPDWTEGQIELGRMLWETGAEDFAAHIRRLLRAQPRRVDLWREFVGLLAGCGDFDAAADAAGEARAATGLAADFALMEAINAGHLGDNKRAEELLPLVPARFPGRAAQQSVQHLRRGDPEQARTAIETALAENPADIGAWAIAELVYRKLGHPRAHWLSGQDGLIRLIELPLSAQEFEAVKALLLRLHLSSVQMIGQSVRSGTQTRGRLFDRTEPELAALRRALDAAIADYAAGLPPADPAHPLLRHRDTPLTIAGSWSVRLTGSGHHVSHMHPQGLISSASYFIVPPGVSPSAGGLLELGAPPPNLMMDLEPLRLVTPEPGRLVLFPSFLHHGTTPFAAGERLTVAFDVNVHPAPR